MLEMLVGIALMAALGGIAWLPWPWLLEASAASLAVGLLVGVPSGLLYHVRLRAALLGAGTLPRDWWLRPVSQHALLSRAALAPVLPSFYVGAASFLLCALGCLLALLAVPGIFGASFAADASRALGS